MTKIVGIRFRNVGKIYYFDPKNYKMKIGDHVIVETARGVEFGRVVLGPKEVSEDEVVHPLKEVLRVATQADEDREKQNRLKEKDAFKICQKKIREHGRSIHLTITKCCFILRQMEELISVSWSRTWQLSLRQESNFARSE